VVELVAAAVPVGLAQPEAVVDPEARAELVAPGGLVAREGLVAPVVLAVVVGPVVAMVGLEGLSIRRVTMTTRSSVQEVLPPASLSTKPRLVVEACSLASPVRWLTASLGAVLRENARSRNAQSLLGRTAMESMVTAVRPMCTVT